MLFSFGSVLFSITTATISRHQWKQLSLSPTKIKKIKIQKNQRVGNIKGIIQILCDISIKITR